MDRRDLLQLLGTSALLAVDPGVLTALARQVRRRPFGQPFEVFTPEQGALVTMVAELIIPRTDTPGATDARVTELIDLLLASWYSDEERERYLTGLIDFRRRARERGGAEFTAQAEPDRTGFLATLDQQPGPPDSAEAFFGRTKSLTIHGYLTAEPVVKDVLHTPIIPGHFDGCIPVGVVRGQ